jgi:hypothetical protein
MIQYCLCMDYVNTFSILSRGIVLQIGSLNSNVALLLTEQNPSSQNC